VPRETASSGPGENTDEPVKKNEGTQDPGAESDTKRKLDAQKDDKKDKEDKKSKDDKKGK
jgi:hypothetical protein